MRKGQHHRKESREKISKSLSNIVPWNKGLTKETSSIIKNIGQKVRESRLGKTYEEIYGKDKAKEMRKLIGIINTGREQTAEKSKKISLALSGKSKSDEHKQHLKDNWDKNHPPEVIEKMAMTTRTNYKKGWFFSVKNHKAIYYQSSYELYAYIRLENDPNVKSYSRCYFKIDYVIDGQKKRYIPDIKVTYTDNTESIIEIKPLGLVEDRYVIAKTEAGSKYCLEHNMDYKIWKEEDTIKFENLVTV